jgi:hypothetical protein
VRCISFLGRTGHTTYPTGGRAVQAFAIVDTRRVYDWVFSIYVPIAIGVFVVFAATIIGATLRYRNRPLTQAASWHEANRLEIAYAVVLTMRHGVSVVCHVPRRASGRHGFGTGPAVKTSNPCLPPRGARCAVGGIRA